MPHSQLEAFVGQVDDPDTVGDALMHAIGLDEIEFHVDVRDEAAAWRWANTNEWLLSSQDEDLVACQLPLPVLVRAALTDECIKSDYCRQLAYDQMRIRVNDVARLDPSGLLNELETMRRELVSLPNATGRPPPNYLVEVAAAIRSGLENRGDAIALARLLGRCCSKNPAQFSIRSLNGGYHITNIDGRGSGVAVKAGRWTATYWRQPEPPDGWWRDGPSHPPTPELQI